MNNLVKEESVLDTVMSSLFAYILIRLFFLFFGVLVEPIDYLWLALIGLPVPIILGISAYYVISDDDLSKRVLRSSIVGFIAVFISEIVGWLVLDYIFKTYVLENSIFRHIVGQFTLLAVGLLFLSLVYSATRVWKNLTLS